MRHWFYICILFFYITPILSLNIFSLDGFYCNRIPGYILGSEHLLHFETILDLLLIILSGGGITDSSVTQVPAVQPSISWYCYMKAALLHFISCITSKAWFAYRATLAFTHTHSQNVRKFNLVNFTTQTSDTRFLIKRKLNQ